MSQKLILRSGDGAVKQNKTKSTNVEVALELGNGQRLEEFEVHARKSLHCHKWVINGDPEVGLGRKEESYRETLHPRE